MEAPSNTGSNQLNIGNIIFGNGIDGTGTTISSGAIAIGTSTFTTDFNVDGSSFFSNNVTIANGALSMAGSDNNIELGDNYLSGDGDDEGIYVSSTGGVGIGTTTPGVEFVVAGDFQLTGGFYDRLNTRGVNGMVLQTTGAGVQWVATSSLGIGGGTSLFTDVGATTYLTSLTDNLAIGTTSANAKLTVAGDINIDSLTAGISFNGTRFLSASTTNGTIAFGENTALAFGGTDFWNVAIGHEAMQNASNQSVSIGIGYRAGLNSTGGNDIMIGDRAGQDNTGGFNVMIGYNSGYLNSGDSNVLLGYNSGFFMSGDENVAIGTSAGSRASGYFNTYFGYAAGSENRSGIETTVLGAMAGEYASSSNRSVLVGVGSYQGSFSNPIEADNITTLGYRAGRNAQTGANNNILIGYQAADSLTTGANNLIIGYDVEAPSNTGVGQLNIGNLIFGTGLDGTGTTLSSGNIGVGTSSPYAKFAVENTGTSPSFFVGDQLNDITPFIISSTGAVGIGTTTPDRELVVSGDFQLTGGIYDNSNSAGLAGYVLQSTNGGIEWVATSTLGIGGGGGSLFTDTGATTYLTSLTDSLAIGTTSANAKLTVAGEINIDSPASGLSILGQRILYASSSNSSVVLGGSAGSAFNTSSQRSVAIGYEALEFGAGSQVSRTVAIGWRAGQNAGTSSFSSESVLIGAEAGQNNTDSSVVAIGWQAAQNNTGNLGGVFIGYQAGQRNSGADVTAVGNVAGIDNTGYGMTFLGANAGQGIVGGEDSVFVGNFAGDITSATHTVAIGSYTLGSGSVQNSLVVGYEAGAAVTTGGDNNVLLGYRAADSLTTGANNIIIGYDVEAPSNTASGQLNIGNLIFGTGIDGTGTTLSSGNIGIGTTTPTTKLTVAGVITPDANNTYSLGNSTYRWSEVFASNGVINTSDARLKENIATSTYGLVELLALSPVSFTWIDQPEQGTKLGLLAQDVQLVLPEIVQVGTDDNQTLGVRYTEIIPVIINSIKELWEMVTGNQAEIEALKERIEALENGSGSGASSSGAQSSSSSGSGGDSSSTSDSESTNEVANASDETASTSEQTITDESESNTASSTNSTSEAAEGSESTTESEEVVEPEPVSEESAQTEEPVEPEPGEVVEPSVDPDASATDPVTS